MENDSQLWPQFLLLRQPFKQQFAVMESVARQDDFILRLLEERLNHGGSVGGGNARHIRTGDDQIRNQNPIPVAARDDGAYHARHLDRGKRLIFQTAYP